MYVQSDSPGGSTDLTHQGTESDRGGGEVSCLQLRCCRVRYVCVLINEYECVDPVHPLHTNNSPTVSLD